jgi:hypothetical protein
MRRRHRSWPDGARILCLTADTNVVDLLPKVRSPTFVVHARGDLRVPFSEDQLIAAGIGGAKFVSLETRRREHGKSDI